MSIKQKHLYDMAWRKLLDLCIRKGKRVTAGEFAKEMGIARSTAQRWLAAMMAEDAVLCFSLIGSNHLPKTVYEPIGLGKTWKYDPINNKEGRK